MRIHWSQVILLVGLLGFVFYIIRLKSIAIQRLIYLLCALIGVILVVEPDLSTWVANQLGIGRGTDLLLYLFIMVALFYSAGVNAEQRRLRQQITTVVRELALAKPLEGEGRQPDHLDQNLPPSFLEK